MNSLRNVCYSYLDTHICDFYHLQFSFMSQIAIGIAATPLVTIIHESGHALAAHLLYKNANVEIKLYSYGFKAGVCRFKRNFLSKLGEWLGRSNVEAIVPAAGPVVQMVTSLMLLRFFPGNGVSFVSLGNNAHSAVRALSAKVFYTRKVEDYKEGNDFVDIKVEKGGFAAETLMITSVALGIFATCSLIKLSIENTFNT